MSVFGVFCLYVPLVEYCQRPCTFKQHMNGRHVGASTDRMSFSWMKSVSAYQKAFDEALQLRPLQLKIHYGYHLIKSGGAVTTNTPSWVRTCWMQMMINMHITPLFLVSWRLDLSRSECCMDTKTFSKTAIFGGFWPIIDASPTTSGIERSRCEANNKAELKKKARETHISLDIQRNPLATQFQQQRCLLYTSSQRFGHFLMNDCISKLFGGKMTTCSLR